MPEIFDFMGFSCHNPGVVSLLYKSAEYKKALKSYKKILKIDKVLDRESPDGVYSAHDRKWEIL